MDRPVNVISHQHPPTGQTFVFFYDDDSFAALLQQFGRMAADRELPEFTWYMAAVLSQIARRRRES